MAATQVDRVRALLLSGIVAIASTHATWAQTSRAAEELRILNEIATQGTSGRFVIKDIQTQPGEPSAATLRQLNPNGWTATIEWPSDRVPVRDLQPFVFGHRSVHRFDGTVRLDTVTFVSTGDRENRLTFCLLDAIGYVYMRGTGRVVFADQRTIEFREGAPPRVTALGNSPGILDIVVSPADAAILVDGKAPAATRPLSIAPGPHLISARRDGYIDAESVVTVQPGERTLLTLTLRALGYLVITAKPADAEVFVDERKVTALTPISVTPGVHTVRAQRLGFTSTTHTVTVESEQRVPFAVALKCTTCPPPRRAFFAWTRNYHLNAPSDAGTFNLRVDDDDVHVSTYYAIAGEPAQYDIGGGARVWQSLAIGATVSHLTVPVDRAIHVEVRATGGSKYAEAAVFIGPSFFRLDQSVVSNTLYLDSGAPVLITPPGGIGESKSSVGFNLGTDVSFLFGGYAGFGFLLRYSRAPLNMTSFGEPAQGHIGWWQFGIGLRARF